ncbi:BH0509 family protein [Aquibacillus koreensis]|uniref:BH0509 family protein n=1 Tax=Aquibacillus koreensis TaxID=279446 RepID=A0A9X3WJA7_9BACI|nr:BH0509 family protein [Aquibacillus koreensis]MCT2534215.1 BH0509 family protein [Aquibacillus koreensis]MDC3420740.1 BH0509 family protein [Aquibacillus koreensis]
MSQIERNDKIEHLLDYNKFNEKEVLSMSDEEVEYFHWLYFEESVYDLM